MRYVHIWKRQTVTLIGLGLTSALIIACGAAAPAEPESAAKPMAEPAQAQVESAEPTVAPVAETTPAAEPPQVAQPEGTLNAGLKELGPLNLHASLIQPPATATFATAPIGESLLAFNSDGEVVPMLAREWSISEDFTTWTFKLEQGVQFHQGYGEMTAEDVVWTGRQWGQNEFQSRNHIIRSFWDSPEGFVETPDQHTVVVNSGTPVPDVQVFSFSTSPSGGGTQVTSKGQTEEIGVEAASLDVAATGPWDLVEAQPAQFWRMRAVEDHWRQTPHFSELVFWEIPEESSRLAGFQTGNLDTFFMDFDSIPLVEEVPGARIMSVPNASPMMIQFFGNYYVGVDTPDQRPGYDPDLPWVSADPEVDSAEWERARKVRLTLITAIDTQSIIETLLRGFAKPAVLHDYVGSEHLLDPDMKWEYDPERARELLAEAGYPDGFKITLTSTVRNAPAELPVCEAIATMWGDIGIDVRFQNVPYTTYRPGTAARSYQGATCFGGRPPVAPSYQFAVIQTAGPINFGVEHPWLEEKTVQAQRAADPVVREQLEREVARFLFDNVFGSIAIYTADSVWPVGPRIEEWSPDVKNYDVRAINGYEYIRPRQQ